MCTINSTIFHGDLRIHLPPARDKTLLVLILILIPFTPISRGLLLLFFSSLLLSHLQPMDLIITILPVVTKDLPISPRFTPYNFLSRCKSSNFTTRQPMVELYFLTFPRFPLQKKEHKSYFGKNQTHDFRTTSRCADYLLDHSGDCTYNI